jgi:predicted CopG family antitoxin
MQSVYNVDNDSNNKRKTISIRQRTYDNLKGLSGAKFGDSFDDLLNLMLCKLKDRELIAKNV